MDRRQQLLHLGRRRFREAGELACEVEHREGGRVACPLIVRQRLVERGARVGGVVAYAASLQFDVRWLVPLAAGNFLYIGASDLVPEVNKAHSLKTSFLHFALFASGLGLLFALAVIGVD